MALTLYQQIAENIKKSENILIVFPKLFHTDHVAASLALVRSLEKIHKTVTVAAAGFVLPQKLSFLSGSEKIQNTVESLRKLLIQLNVSKTKVSDFSYEVKDQMLNIYITPENGNYTEKDVSIKRSGANYDLVFVIGAHELESLGELYEKNRAFFFEAPIVNIDHSPKNENFGQVNLIEQTATSCSEVIYSLLMSLNPKLLDEEVATALLAGITSATQAFRSSKLTPRALEIASDLVEKHAKRKQVIEQLYYNRKFATLKLWGTLLTRLRHDLNNRLIWTNATKSDFENTKTNESDIPDIFEELISNVSGAEIAMIFYEKALGVGIYVCSFGKRDLLESLKHFSPVGSPDSVHIDVEKQNITEVEQKFTRNIADILKMQDNVKKAPLTSAESRPAQTTQRTEQPRNLPDQSSAKK